MKPRARWYAELRTLSPSEWNRFLDEHSGLPGPRANTELAIAFAEVADQSQANTAANELDEYLAMCGTVALGARAADPHALAKLHQLAADSRWRVREAVALGLQLLGDDNFDKLARIVKTWIHDPDPLVQRAAVVAICEPRLLNGYCWSVAVAAAPETGLSAFRQLDGGDADVNWIVAQNLRKKRLANLL